MIYLGWSFRDSASGQHIGHYRDRLNGHVWMAESSVSLFRVAVARRSNTSNTSTTWCQNVQEEKT
jgi:hypothetical protein